MTVGAPWNAPGYQRFADVRRRGDQLVVRFEDGTVAQVDVAQVVPTNADEVDWDALTFNAYEIHVPSADGDIEIPWSTVRVLTDPLYSAHLAAAAVEQARRIGSRLQELRRQRHISARELAARAGITPAQVSRVERGDPAEVFTALTKLLAAMGCTLRDLVSEGHRSADQSELPRPPAAPYSDTRSRLDRSQGLHT